MSMDTVASITWPNGQTTKVWGRPSGDDLVFWTGPEDSFPAVAAEFERDPDRANRVGIDLIDLRLDLLGSHEEQVADTDRDLLAEIDALLDIVRACGSA